MENYFDQLRAIMENRKKKHWVFYSTSGEAKIIKNPDVFRANMRTEKISGILVEERTNQNKIDKHNKKSFLVRLYRQIILNIQLIKFIIKLK